MSTIDLDSSEYRRANKTQREPILAPYWWVGVTHIASVYLLAALLNWLFEGFWR
jgi:hypothetical protein